MVWKLKDKRKERKEMKNGIELRRKKATKTILILIVYLKIFNDRYFRFTHHDYIASGYKTSDRGIVLIIPQRILNNNSILSTRINQPRLIHKDCVIEGGCWPRNYAK